MRHIIYIFAIVLLFSSCYSVKDAQKNVLRAHLTYPIVTSNFCAETFPVKETIIEKIKLIKGKDIIKTDTVVVDCDRIVNDPKTNNRVVVKYRNIYRTDTIVKKQIKTIENTAKIKTLTLKILQKENTIDSKEKRISILQWILGASLISLLLLIFIKR